MSNWVFPRDQARRCPSDEAAKRERESLFVSKRCDERHSQWLGGVRKGTFGTRRNTIDGVKHKCIRWGDTLRTPYYIPRDVDDQVTREQ